MVKVLLTLIVVWAGLRLWPQFVLLLISLLLAVALHPVVTALERRGLGRGAVVGLMTLLCAWPPPLLVTVVFTSLAEQVSKLVQDFPALRDRVEQRVPAAYPTLKRVVREIFALPSSPEVAAQLKRPLMLGTVALSGVVSIFFTIIVTIYLLLDGKRLYAWLIAYIPRVHRERMAVTASEVSDVVCAYVRGQAIISLLFTVYAAIVLSVLRVPAVVAARDPRRVVRRHPGGRRRAGDGARRAAGVHGVAGDGGDRVRCYITYHVIESYLIVPRVYGTRLRLSTLAVVLALLVGTTLQGLVGAVLVLPLVAAYPIIERIWLASYLAPDAVKDHNALAKVDGDAHEAAVEAVLQGEKHPWEGPTLSKQTRAGG